MVTVQRARGTVRDGDTKTRRVSPVAINRAAMEKPRKVAKSYAKSTGGERHGRVCRWMSTTVTEGGRYAHACAHDCVTDVIILRNWEPSSGICNLHACESELAEQYAQQFALIRYCKLCRGKSDVRC